MLPFPDPVDNLLEFEIAVSTGPLSSGRLNLAQIRESYVRDMLNLLDSVGGTKCLVWDDELVSPVSTFIQYPILNVSMIPE